MRLLFLANLYTCCLAQRLAAIGQLYWAPSKAVTVVGRYFICLAVAPSPTGPCKLATGKDVFTKPFS